MHLHIEELENLENLSIRCLNTGTYVRFLLTEAQGGTFVDTQMGMEPRALATSVFDTVAGRRYFAGWLADTITSLIAAAPARARAA